MATPDLDSAYGEIRRTAEVDCDVVGLVLCGSRGKGLADEHSDYDVMLVVDPAARMRLEERFKRLPPGIDLWLQTMASLKTEPSKGHLWERYDWAHVEPVIDKTSGRLGAILREESLVPMSDLRELIASSLDHALNQLYRSMKCLRRGDRIAQRLEAHELLIPFLDSAFALHGRRVRPYWKYLEWELTRFPLERLPWRGSALVELLLRVLTDGDRPSQQELVRGLEPVARAAGFGSVFDAWEGKDRWALEFEPT